MTSYRTISRDAMRGKLDAGWSFTIAGLYEPEHAKAGTEFVKFNGYLVRLHEPRCLCLRCYALVSARKGQRV